VRYPQLIEDSHVIISVPVMLMGIRCTEPHTGFLKPIGEMRIAWTIHHLLPCRILAWVGQTFGSSYNEWTV